jgi:hypothetical protein
MPLIIGSVITEVAEIHAKAQNRTILSVFFLGPLAVLKNLIPVSAPRTGAKKHLGLNPFLTAVALVNTIPLYWMAQFANNCIAVKLSITPISQQSMIFQKSKTLVRFVITTSKDG